MVATACRDDVAGTPGLEEAKKPSTDKSVESIIRLMPWSPRSALPSGVVMTHRLAPLFITPYL